ncbi:kinase-like domain, phloem protein 2-like protein [Tanacetum coccineum]
MNPSALETFASVAYECLNSLREERPSMSFIVEELKDAFEVQERHDIISKFSLPKEYEEIVQSATSCLMYTEELKGLLSKGVLVNKGKTWLSINEKGEHIERIYIEACMDLNTIKAYNLHDPSYYDIVNSRFPGGKCYKYDSVLKACARSQYLTPQISYTLNLVFRYKKQSEVNECNIILRYKVDGEAQVSIIYPTNMREDGWFVVPLYQFTSQHTTVDILFEFENRRFSLIVVGFEFQPFEEKVELQVFEEYQHIVEAASQSLACRSFQELKQILSVGIHLNGYKTWFSLNEKGEHCHMISMKDCLIPNEDFTPRYKSHSQSRFPAGFYDTEQKGFRTHVKTQLLNPLIPYTVNLIFYFHLSYHEAYIDLKYRVNGETRTSTVYLAKKRDDFLHMAELYQVTSNGGLVDLEIDFENPGINIKGVEGILFQPLEKVEDQVLEDDKVEDIQPVLDSDSDTYWGQKLPDDYEEILKMSKHSVEGKTKKELYSMFCQGFLINNGQQWLAVNKNGKKWQMLSTRTCVIDERIFLTWESSNESRCGDELARHILGGNSPPPRHHTKVAHQKDAHRGSEEEKDKLGDALPQLKALFGEVLVITAGYTLEIVRDLEYTSLSPDTTYASYLVYNLPEDQSTFEVPMFAWERDGYRNGPNGWYLYLGSPPNTPVIGRKLDKNSYNPLNRHKLNALPRQRSDGWMEVKVWDFQTEKTPKTVSMNLMVKHPVMKDLCGLIIQGIEVRPI